MSRRPLGLLVVLCTIAVPLLLAACGGTGGGGVTASGSVHCHATDVKVGLSEYTFTPKNLSVPSGTTTFCLTDTGQMEHDMVIGNQQGTQTLDQSATLQPGDVSRFQVSLQPGTYMIWCSIPGHRAAGMVGTLTVT